MSDQLFTNYGYVRPTRTSSKGRTRSIECAIEGCTKPRRNAQAAKYCEDHATSINYELSRNVPSHVGPCLVCGTQVTQPRKIGQRSLITCREHGHLVTMFKSWRSRYNLTGDQITTMITNAHCWICGDSLAWRFTNWGKAKQSADKVHVDHDHRCCEGESSCGLCVRGLAHASCNRRIAQVEALINHLGTERAHQLIDELASQKNGAPF